MNLGIKTTTSREHSQQFSKVIVEGCSVDVLPKNLAKEFELLGLTQSGYINVTGLVRLSSGLFAILPKGFGNTLSTLTACREDEIDVMRKVSLMARIVSKCLREKKFRTKYLESGHFLPSKTFRDSDSLDCIEAAFLLRKDFLENGYYWQKQHRRMIDVFDHPIDWNKTLAHFPPDLSDNEVVFRHTIHSARIKQTDDYFHRLHATCVEQVFALFGDFRTISEGRGLNESEFKSLTRKPETIILPLLNRTYRERGRVLLQLMLVWLRGRSMFTTKGNAQAENTGFCCNFYCVWEHMLRELLDNVMPEDRILEKGIWENAAPKEEFFSGSPELDLRRSITVGKDKILIDCILDAKDKKIEIGVRSGSAADHYKQIMYSQLTQGSRNGQLFNALMFPTSGGKETFVLLGKHNWNSLTGSEVYEISVDIEEISNAWLRGRSIPVELDFSAFVERTLGIQQ